VALVVVNTVFWGLAIRQVTPGGSVQYNLQFVLKLGTNPYFILAMVSALAATLVQYYARATLGLAKGGLFYSLGTVALVFTSYFAFGEKFTWENALGIILIMVGTVLVT
jgi:drug/metabolite transporter (DMT)-like permease